MSHRATEIKTIAHLLCCEQYFGEPIIGPPSESIFCTHPSWSPLFRRPVWIANEVRLMNESAEGIKLL